MFWPKIHAFFQFSPVLSLIGNTASDISFLQSSSNDCSLKVLPLSLMDPSSRIRMQLPSTPQASTSHDEQARAPTTTTQEPPMPVEESQSRVDQHGLVQTHLQSDVHQPRSPEWQCKLLKCNH